MRTAKYAAPNCQIVVSDPDAKVEVPQWPVNSVNMPVRLIWTDTCILVGCLMDADGETEFTLGEIHEVDPGHPPVFQGKLKTPTRKVSLETVHGHTVLQTPVPRLETTIRVWTNHYSEPDKVIVGVE